VNYPTKKAHLGDKSKTHKLRRYNQLKYQAGLCWEDKAEKSPENLMSDYIVNYFICLFINHCDDIFRHTL